MVDKLVEKMEDYMSKEATVYDAWLIQGVLFMLFVIIPILLDTI